ncbi:hypothetical protein EB061_08310 [bacterium]|nr:hypothetical protein [bacterium]
MVQKDWRDPLPPGSPGRKQWAGLLDPVLSHGGPAARGKRKAKRPFFPGAPQLVLLSSRRAKGGWNLAHRRHRARITAQAYTYAKRFRVRVLTLRILSDQIQLMVRAKERKDLADFFRVFAGRVAISVTGAKRRVRRTGRFWNELCFSRILNWGSEFHTFRGLLFAGEPRLISLTADGSAAGPEWSAGGRGS